MKTGGSPWENGLTWESLSPLITQQNKANEISQVRLIHLHCWIWRSGSGGTPYQVLGWLKDSQISKSHNQIATHSANYAKLLLPADQVLQVWASCGHISLWGLMPFSLSASRLNNRQLWQMEPYPHRSREAPDLKCKRASSDWEEEEAMSQGSRRQSRLPWEHKANSSTNSLLVQDKPINCTPARWQVAASWTRL